MAKNAVSLHIALLVQCRRVLGTAQIFAVPCSIISMHCAMTCSGLLEAANILIDCIIDKVGKVHLCGINKKSQQNCGRTVISHSCLVDGTHHSDQVDECLFMKWHWENETKNAVFFAVPCTGLENVFCAVALPCRMCRVKMQCRAEEDAAGHL